MKKKVRLFSKNVLSFIFLASFCLLSANAQTTLYEEDFAGQNGKGQIGSTNDVVGVDWSIDVSDGEFGNESDYFAVQNEVFEGQDVDGDVIWTSQSFSITNFSNLSFSFQAKADGDFEANGDVFVIDIVIDGNTENLFTGVVDEDEPGDPFYFGNTKLNPGLQNFSKSISSTGDNAFIKITINNNAGSELQGFDEISVEGFGAGGNIAPIISNIVQDPAEGNVISTDMVSISADATDLDDDIASVQLLWGTTSGNLDNGIIMGSISGDTYTSNTPIPAQTNGTTIYYQVIAIDDNTSPEMTTSAEQSYTVDDSVEVIDEDFSDCGNLSFLAVSVASNADWECENDFEEINAFGADEPANDYLISEEINLDIYGNEVLTFESFNQFADAGISGPEVELLYTTNYTNDPSTTTWVNLTATFAAEDSSTWTPSGDIDVSGISGTAVRFAFHYVSSGTGGGDSSLWRIDDVALSGIITGNLAPDISNIVQTPTNVSSSNTVSVSADVTDSDDIASVNLNWGTTSGNLINTIAMNLDSGNTYTTASNIPAQANGTIVYYEIEATDNNASPATNTSLEQSYQVNDPLSLILTEIADPDDNSNARFVEIYNNGTMPIDFSNTTVFLARYANANSNPQTVQLTGTLAEGEYYVIAGNNSNFNDAYGFTANIDSGIVSGNGDDTYTLYFGGDDETGQLLDVYGEIGTDGTGQPWEYEDSRAVRNDITDAPSTTWLEAQWTITPANVADMTPGEGEATTYVYNNGTWTPTDPVGNAQPTENIRVESGAATISSALVINKVTVNTGATLNIEDVLTVNGNIVNNGDLVFVSNATTTGQLASVPSSVSVNGAVTVQRYIPSGTRAFRFLSSSVTTTSSIQENWQEGATSATDNPNPGFGFHITGAIDGSNGFDATPSGNPSLFDFNNSAGTWNAVTNTDVNTLTAGKAYRVFVRGNRSIDVTDNDATPTETVIRATGNLVTGDQVINGLGETSGDFNLIGNPYQAIVDMTLVLGNSTNVNTNQYYVWDPNMNAQGAYVTVDLTTGSPTPATSDANQFLQPGQSVFVNTLNDGAASILFEELDKDTDEALTSVFRNANALEDNVSLDIELQTQDAYASNGSLADAAKVKFAANASNEVLANDALKLTNIDENLALVNGENYLSIESRGLPQAGEVLPLFTDQYRNDAYVLKINLNNIEGVSAHLNDAYLGTQTELELDTENVISFTVDANIEASSATNRFSVGFAENNLNTASYNTNVFNLYPNPSNNGEFNIQLNGTNNSENVTVSVYSMLGNKVFEKEAKASGNQLKITQANLSAGVYLIQLNNGKTTSTKKLMVK